MYDSISKKKALYGVEDFRKRAISATALYLASILSTLAQ
jgi:hypothetical protein